MCLRIAQRVQRGGERKKAAVRTCQAGTPCGGLQTTQMAALTFKESESPAELLSDPRPLPFCLCLRFGTSILSGCLTLLSCISVSLGIGPFSPGSTWQGDLPAFFVVCLPWVPRNNGVLSGSVFPPCLGGSFPSVWSPLGTHCCTDLLFLS